MIAALLLLMLAQQPANRLDTVGGWTPIDSFTFQTHAMNIVTQTGFVLLERQLYTGSLYGLETLILNQLTYQPVPLTWSYNNLLDGGYIFGGRVVTGIIDTPIITPVITMYPNPFSGAFSVQSDVTGLIVFYSAAGVQIRSLTLHRGTQMIDLGSVPSGVYYWHFGTHSGRIVRIR